MLPSSVHAPTAAMTLADFTSPGMVVPQLRSRDAAGVIQELSQALQREKRIPDLLPFYHAALNRELLISSDWEAGMAFPHARLPALKEVSFALGRSHQPLAWSGKAVHSVRWVFLIAVPATDSTQYLSLISGLARLAKEERFVKALHAAREAMDIIAVLKQVELRASPAQDAARSLGV